MRLFSENIPGLNRMIEHMAAVLEPVTNIKTVLNTIAVCGIKACIPDTRIWLREDQIPLDQRESRRLKKKKKNSMEVEGDNNDPVRAHPMIREWLVNLVFDPHNLVNDVLHHVPQLPMIAAATFSNAIRMYAQHPFRTVIKLAFARQSLSVMGVSLWCQFRAIFARLSQERQEDEQIVCVVPIGTRGGTWSNSKKRMCLQFETVFIWLFDAAQNGMIDLKHFHIHVDIDRLTKKLDDENVTRFMDMGGTIWVRITDMKAENYGEWENLNDVKDQFWHVVRVLNGGYLSVDALNELRKNCNNGRADLDRELNAVASGLSQITL